MSISDLYSSGTHKKEISHFANIVKLALLDDNIATGEQKLIDSMAKRLNITEIEYAEILKNPNDFPITVALEYNKRIERLFNLTKMVFADNKATEDQRGLLNKITIGLGFSKDHYKTVTNEAIQQMINNCTLEEFSVAIKKVN